jgi:hypothetical protein
MRTTTKILIGVLIVLIVIQFIKPDRNINPQEQKRHIAQFVPVPQDVQIVLKRACYDCHSNNTRYPWYANIQPIAWYLAHHVKEGKAELNFDEFTSYDAKKQDHKLEEVAETVEEGEMPLSSYTLIHKDAKLAEQERTLLVDWAKKARVRLTGGSGESEHQH